MTIQIDLFSDTMSQPTDAMRRAMADAIVGNAPMKEDKLNNRLVAMTAELLGKEDAIFLPSGTMCNAVAYRVHCRPGDEVIVDRKCHAIHSEAGGAAGLSGVLFATVEGKRGVFSAADVESAVRHPPTPIRPRSRMVVVEQTSMRAGGTIWPMETIREVSDAARRYGLTVHMDGARLLNAVARSGVSAADYAAPCDTAWLDFSKGLAAPVGAVLAGSKDFIEECWRYSTQFGGAMRKTGMLAAACIHALEHNVERLAEDNDNAKWLAQQLSQLEGIDIDPDHVESNMVIFDVSKTGLTPGYLHQRLMESGIRVGVFGPTLMRAVTYLDITRAHLQQVVSAFQKILAEPRHEKPGAAASPVATY